jgi:ubiquinone/menaquinone biosynthesis C-methylase UbiE
MDTTEQIRAIWDGASVTYDSSPGHGVSEGAEKTAWLALLRRLLPPDRPLEVLDVGTGTGEMACVVAELGHRVTGIDISEKMLAVAQAKAERYGGRLSFREGDAVSPPFADGSFDAVLCRHLMWTLPEPERAVREWARVTRAGGQVIALDGFFRQGTSGRIASFGFSLVDRLPGRGRSHHGYPPELDARLPLVDNAGLEAPRNIFLRAGLRDVRAEELTAITAAVSATMPRKRRLTSGWRHYMVEGTS